MFLKCFRASTLLGAILCSLNAYSTGTYTEAFEKEVTIKNCKNLICTVVNEGQPSRVIETHKLVEVGRRYGPQGIEIHQVSVPTTTTISGYDVWACKNCSALHHFFNPSPPKVEFLSEDSKRIMRVNTFWTDRFCLNPNINDKHVSLLHDIWKKSEYKIEYEDRNKWDIVLRAMWKEARKLDGELPEEEKMNFDFFGPNENKAKDIEKKSNPKIVYEVKKSSCAIQ